MKFTDQGEIKVSVEASGPPDENLELHVAVRDTGIGIPRHLQSRIFEPFTQADESATRRHEGTGLGLAMASRLAELMGGRLWVQSVAGGGSTFHFTAIFGVPTQGEGLPEARPGGAA